jgi:hypothetical protein
MKQPYRGSDVLVFQNEASALPTLQDKYQTLSQKDLGLL